jgi:hypothetical protein
MNLIFQLLEVDRVKGPATDKSEPFKPFTDKTIANFGLAGTLELYNMSGLRCCRDNATEII